MAELYENPRHYVTEGGTVGNSANGAPTFERMLADLPPEEREEAMKYITAPPSGEEIMRAMQEKNSNGEVMNMTLEQYRLYKAHNKTKEVDVIAGIGEAAGTVFEEISKAAGFIVDNPVDALQKLTPSVIEAFAQGTRSMYGMAAQSADPNSIFFRMKNALQANGDDEEAEYQQFMEAQAFNVHSMRLMTGQDTIIMDKDVINPEMTQVMSYIADPTLFVPFGGLAAKGATMIGMGEKLAMAAARTQGIRNLVLGGAIKWGVGAPLEFMGGAIRNTIDYGIDTGSRVFETATGVAAKDIASAARVGSLGTAAGSVAGLEVNSTLASASRYYAGSLVARNVGETASIFGEQMMKQGKTGRGVLGYAGQAIRDSERAGIKLAPHTKALLKAIEAVDPLFVYADDIASGAAQGAIIGGGLGYLAGGEEGFAGGVGSGMALGTVGATAGKIVSDITGNTKIDQMRIQRKLIIEALKENGNENAVGFEAMAAMAEATGDRAFMGYIDGIIAGIDTVNPDSVFKAFNTKEYKEHLTRMGIDPDTGVLLEKSRIFPELNDRTVKADVLGILRDTGNRFAGDAEGFERAIQTAPEFAKLKPVWSRLDDNAKAVILKQVKDNGDPAFVKGLRGRQLNAHWGDLAYSERLADMINTLNQKNSNSVPDKIRETLKAETRRDKKLTRRGQMLKEKLQADGYIDKDGNIRQRRLADVEGTQGEFEASAGWAKSRDSSGRTEVVINLDKWAMDSGNRLSLAHELYHSIMLDSVFAPDYIDRLSQKLLGKFDPKTGRVLEQALVAPDELMKFFGKYIENDPNNKRDPETIKRKKEELKKSIEDYRTRGTANRVADPTAIPLEHLVEEFGAYYFSKWVKAQPIDYMFRGGEFGGIRGLFEMASDGWLDYWKGKVGEKNPNFNFDAMGERGVSKAFERDGKRVSSRSLDLFMRDIVRIEANRNSNNGFDVNKLSKESREWFLKVNGLRGAAFGQLDQQGNVKKPRLRRYTAEEIRQGKEMFKVLESLPDAAHKDGMRRDGDGNWSGQPNTAQINALVGAGYIQRAWFDRMTRAFDIVNGNGSNVVEFGYLGYSAHIGDGNERVYGAAVPFKNRRAVLIGVDFKVRADGSVYSNLHTLDLKVIEARGNEVWKDPQTRELWKGSRTDMEADFYAYLSNASLPSDHPNRKPSAKILDKGDGLGGQRRDALHQMLGFHKGSDMPYINRPIAEIPVGIRHSVTTFSNDGIVNMRVDNKPRYDFNFENAHLDLSRNFMPDEMRQETTPSGGKIIKHATGYQISKQAGTKFKVFDPEGKHLGDFDTVADAGRAAQKHFNTTHEAKTEGVDPAVPRTEIPPSRVAYIDRELAGITDNIAGGKEKFLENVNVLIDRILASPDNLYPQEGKAELLKIRKSIEETGNIKISELKDLKRLERINRVHDMKRLPYYNYDYFMELIDDTVVRNFDRIGKQYDAMYPMEIKSALHPRLAQIFQDYPNITAQGLLKKLVTYGSRGNRFFQEATEIGLVDRLKSRRKIKTDVRRVFDLQKQDFTGEVKTVQNLVPSQIPFTPFEMQEILDFAKSKEIRVTIEEGARERSGMDTSRYTLGGAKDNYKETAVRINPEYAHGISGHYGEDTIVHFRTTERLDADGNRHLYIEEVQANNSDNSKAVSEVALRRMRTDLETLKQYKKDAIDAGVFVVGESDTGSKTYVNERENWFKEYGYSEAYNMIREAVRKEITGAGFDYALDRDTMTNAIMDEITYAIEQQHIKTGEDFTERVGDLLLSNYSTDKHYKIFEAFRKSEGGKQFIESAGRRIERDYKFFQDKGTPLLNRDLHEAPYNATSIMEHQSIREHISDLNTSILQSTIKGKTHPMTDVKDWTLTALKGIIRQGIRDGLDKITLTHPDDSPTVSHMKGDARKGLYGKLIPEVWGSWLRKYGIEMKQTNKLADATIDTAKGQMAEITNKLHDANKAVLEHFEQVKGGEDPATINNLAQLMATPVHEVDDGIGTQITIDALKINDNKLQSLIGEVALLKKSEYEAYTRVNKLREGGVRASSDTRSNTDAGISAEAIDRGMTFELNDRLKREFLEGRINTHSMPAEDIYSGGRVYDQNSKQFKSSFIGKYAEENPERLQNKNIEFVKRRDGSYRITMTDNSGATKKIGHITADLDMRVKGEGIAVISSNIDKKFRGNKLANVLYSEMAERLRAMGVKYVDGTIVNPEGIPVQVRNSVIGQTYYKGSNKPALREDAAKKIQAVQSIYPSKGIDVYNELDFNARYQPAEGEQGRRTYTQKQIDGEFIGRIASENPELKKGLKLYYGKVPQGMGAVGVTLRNKKGDVVANIKAMINRDAPNYANIEYSEVTKKQQGKGFGKLVYSELIERLRSLGVEEVSGTVIDAEGRPQAIRRKVIDKVNEEFWRDFSKENRFRKTRESESEDLSEGTEVISQLHKKAWYMPDDYQGGDDYYKPRSNPFERKDEQGFLIREPYIRKPAKTASGEKFEMNPDNVSWEDVGHFERLTKKETGLSDKELYEWENNDVGLWAFNTNTDAVVTKNKINPREVGFRYTHGEWFDEPFWSKNYTSIWGRYEKPIYDKDGNLVRRGRVSMTGQYRGSIKDMAHAKRIKNDIAKKVKASAEDIDAYMFDASDSIKQSMGLSPKDQLPIKFQPAEGNDYRGTHKSPSGEDGAGSLDAMDRTYPNDLYSAQGARFYGDGQPKLDKQMHDIIMRLKGKPDAMVTVYRAVPKGVDASITKGDWVTPLREYAVLHGNRWEQGMTILEKKVKASELFTEGNSLYEFGWSPKEVTKADSLRKEIADQEKWIERSRNKAPIMWETKGSKIYGQREAMERKLSSLKYELKQAEKDNKPKFQPAEGEQGGRVYTDKQFNQEFIGKFASQNPEIADKFSIRIKENDGGTLEDWDYKMVIYDKQTKKAVARTKWQMFENDDGVLEDAAADVEILNDAYKGMKLSHLMQSERLERSRFRGAEKVRSQITNEEGIPIKNYAKTIGADKGEITSSFAERFDEDGMTQYVPATMENFKQEMDLSKEHADGTWKPTVYYRANLDSNAWYQPAEYSEFKSEQSPMGRILRNAKGYVIMLANNKFRVYNPAKAIIGVYGSEEEAKKRIYKEIPKQ